MYESTRFIGNFGSLTSAFYALVSHSYHTKIVYGILLRYNYSFNPIVDHLSCSTKVKRNFWYF